MQSLKALGVIASEMEASHMFVLGAAHGGIPSPISRWATEPRGTLTAELRIFERGVCY